MSLYFNRKGEPIDMDTWAALMEADKRIAQTTFPDGTWISTVWLGIDHNHSGAGPPVIFETMVFPSVKELNELDTLRYSTEVDARAGHAMMVERWFKKLSGHGKAEFVAEERHEEDRASES